MKFYLDTEFHEYSKKANIFGLNLGKSTPTIDLISIGIVSEDGREFYAVCRDFDVDAAWNNEWLRENVLHKIFFELYQRLDAFAKSYGSTWFPYNAKGLKKLLKIGGKTKKQIASDILTFIDERYANGKDESGGFIYPCDDFPTNRIQTKNVEFYAYYADYDWVVFCWLFGRMIDLPKGFPMYCRDLKQLLDDLQSRTQNVQRVGWNVIEEKGMKTKDAFLIKNHPQFPQLHNEHNALADAHWNKKLHEFLQNI